MSTYQYASIKYIDGRAGYIFIINGTQVIPGGTYTITSSTTAALTLGSNTEFSGGAVSWDGSVTRSIGVIGSPTFSTVTSSAMVSDSLTVPGIYATTGVGLNIYNHNTTGGAAVEGMIFSTDTGAITLIAPGGIVFNVAPSGVAELTTAARIGGVVIATISGSQTLTNKSISGADNTITSIGDASLSTSYVKADGTRPLTGNWDVGAFSVTAQSIVTNTLSTATDADMTATAGATNRSINLTPTGSGSVKVADGKKMKVDTINEATTNATTVTLANAGTSTNAAAVAVSSTSGGITLTPAANKDTTITHSGTGKLAVTGDITSSGMLKLTTVGDGTKIQLLGSDNYAHIEHGGSWALRNYSGSTADVSTGQYEWYTVNGASSWTNRMTLSNAGLLTPTSLNIASGTFAVTSAGIMTNSTQPLCVVYKSSTTNNVTGNGTVYQPIMDTATRNVGTCYNTSTGVFTAPVTGTYSLQSNTTLNGVTAGMTDFGIVFKSGSLYWNGDTGGNAGTAMRSDGTLVLKAAAIVYLTISDTVVVEINVGGGAGDDADLFGNASDQATRFSAVLLA